MEHEDQLDPTPAEPKPTETTGTLANRLTSMFFGKRAKKTGDQVKGLFDTKSKSKKANKRKRGDKAQPRYPKRTKRSTEQTIALSDNSDETTDLQESVTESLPNREEMQAAEEATLEADSFCAAEVSEIHPVFSQQPGSNQVMYNDPTQGQLALQERPFTLLSAPTSFDIHGAPKPPTGFQLAQPGRESLVLVGEIFSYIIAGQLELYSIKAEDFVSEEFSMQRFYAVYYTLIGFATILLPRRLTSITRIANASYVVLVASQVDPDQHQTKIEPCRPH
ncbi:unnamed protein product [Oikopleura dioica]|uniref:Uncharacterized protein n=1 Tax=Oikopleura dioica TaxID=34765 RepID=E4Y5J3_OIKDI|nr:unnamed protein product [Oikopleura dioica]